MKTLVGTPDPEEPDDFADGVVDYRFADNVTSSFPDCMTWTTGNGTTVLLTLST